MKQIYVSYIDEVPDLTLEPHEVCEPLTSEEVVFMWYTLKTTYLKVLNQAKENQ